MNVWQLEQARRLLTEGLSTIPARCPDCDCDIDVSREVSYREADRVLQELLELLGGR